MTVPSPDEIRRFIERYFRCWNEHDKDGFMATWKSFATDICMEDPIGAPTRRGWDVLSAAWDLMNATLTMNVERLILCAREAAFVVRGEFLIDGSPTTIYSIETMRMEEDGSVLLRTWWEPQGEMLEGYAAGREP
jgi:hypothetical protein